MNAVRRSAICASILARFFFATSEKMIVQAKAAFNLFESIGLAASLADRTQFLQGEVFVFEILEMVQDGFP
jgi:hypothetical protein